MTHPVDAPLTPLKSTDHERQFSTAAGPAAAVRAGRRLWPGVLGLAYLGQVAFRLVLVRHQDYPVVSPDEQIYLVLARMIAGRPTTELPGAQVIPGGYPLLISPALALADDPVTAYHLVMVLNALISCLVLPLAFLALRQLGLPRPAAFATANTAALLPPVVFYSQYAMADTALPALLLGWLLALRHLLSDGSRRGRQLAGVATGAIAASALAVHDRGGVVVALTALTLLAALILNWAPRTATALGLATLAVASVAAKLLARWLVTRFDQAQPSAVGTALLNGITDPALAGRTFTRVAGQIWYFTTSSWGIGGLGIAACVACLATTTTERASKVVACVALATLGGIALASAAALPDDQRVDDWTYARYLSPLIPVFFTIGIAALHRARPLALAVLAGAVGALTMACVAQVTSYAGPLLRTQYYIPWTLPDASFLAGHWNGLHMLRTSLAALAVLAGCTVLVRVGGRRVPWGLGASLGLFALVATVSITADVTEPSAAWGAHNATGFSQDAGIRSDDDLVMDAGVRWEIRMTQAFEVYQGRVWTRDLVHGQVPPASAAVAALPMGPEGTPATASWPNTPAGWHVAVGHTGQGYVIWRRDR